MTHLNNKVSRLKVFTALTATCFAGSAYSGPVLYPTTDSSFSSVADLVYDPEPYVDIQVESTDTDLSGTNNDGAAKSVASAEAQKIGLVTGLRGRESVRVGFSYTAAKIRRTDKVGLTMDSLEDSSKSEFSNAESRYKAAFAMTESITFGSDFVVPLYAQDYFSPALTWRSEGNRLALQYEPRRKSSQSPESISISYSRAWERFNLSAGAKQVSSGAFDGYKDRLEMKAGTEIQAGSRTLLGIALTSKPRHAKVVDKFDGSTVEQTIYDLTLQQGFSDSMSAIIRATLIPELKAKMEGDGETREGQTTASAYSITFRKFL